MKLKTEIPPRRDGTLTVTDEDGTVYQCERDEDGEMCVDVPDTLAARLIAAGTFYPADPVDYETALGMVSEDDDGEDDADDDMDDNPGGMPVEANTPPAPPAPANKRGPGRPKKA